MLRTSASFRVGCRNSDTALNLRGVRTGRFTAVIHFGADGFANVKVPLDFVDTDIKKHLPISADIMEQDWPMICLRVQGRRYWVDLRKLHKFVHT